MSRRQSFKYETPNMSETGGLDDLENEWFTQEKEKKKQQGMEDRERLMAKIHRDRKL